VKDAILQIVVQGQQAFYSTKNRDTAAADKLAAGPSSLKVQGTKVPHALQAKTGGTHSAAKAKKAEFAAKTAFLAAESTGIDTGVAGSIDDHLALVGLRDDDMDTVK